MNYQKKQLTKNFAFLWLLTIGLGLTKLFAFSFTPGMPSQPLKAWPDGTSLKRDLTRPTVLVFIHPHCSCSLATVNELDRLMTAIQQKALVIVVLARPKNRSMEWTKGRVLDQLLQIPYIKINLDRDEQDSQIFGAQTSGEVMLFDVAGNQIFHGGITPSRGHSGDNESQLALSSFFKNGILSEKKTPVFGCALFNRKEGVLE